MPASKKTSPASKTASASTASRGSEPAADAIKLLTEDHKEVKALFKAYEKLVHSDAEDDDKMQMAQDICTLLTVHATAEEELFYPAAREVLGDKVDLIDEADIEHACAKDLIAQIQSASPADDDHFDAKVKVLGEYIDHHVREEEGELFPKVRKALPGLDAFGQEIAARKEELLAELAESAEED